jgi:hypothetical protein
VRIESTLGQPTREMKRDVFLKFYLHCQNRLSRFSLNPPHLHALG